MIQRNKLHTQDTKKWKPRNLQAALIIRKAREEEMPPEVRPLPRFIPSPEQIAKQKADEYAANAARLKAENGLWEKAHRSQKPRQKPKVAKCLWAAKAEAQRRKRLGLPPMTANERLAIRKAQPIFGQVVSQPNNQDQPNSGEDLA